jgi:hypothetical protein
MTGCFQTEAPISPLFISSVIKMDKAECEILFRFLHQLWEKEFEHGQGLRPQGYWGMLIAGHSNLKPTGS